MNEIGVARIDFDRPLVVADYARDRELGGFILIDRISDQTVAIGLVDTIAPPPDTASGVLVRLNHEFLHRLGASGSQRRRNLYRALAREAGEQLVPWVLILLLAGSVTLACTISVASIVCRPVIRCLLDAVWRHAPRANPEPETGAR